MIAVIGLGFVGLTTAVGFAEVTGKKVFCYDIDKNRSDLIKSGIVPFHEPHLGEYLNKHLNKNIIITETISQAIREAEIIFLCVGTPCNDKGNADLSYITAAVNEICAHLNGQYKVITVKSTVPPATISHAVRKIVEENGLKAGEDIGLAHNPEFLREGKCWDDFVYPDRIVIGEYDKKSGDMLENLYKPFNVKIYRVNANTGEFIKYLSNTLLATLISWSNDMSMIADAIGDIDIKAAFEILHEDKRWSGSPANMASYAFPGCGFGGYCLPKDTQALYSKGVECGHESLILQSVIKINEKIAEKTADKIISAVSNDDRKVAVLGLSFKPDSDDVRETPAAAIIKRLCNEGIEIYAYDPLANDVFKNKYISLPINYKESMEEAIADCSVVAVLTAWAEFKEKAEILRDKTVIDGRYIYDNVGDF